MSTERVEPELPLREGDDIPVVNTTHYQSATLSWQLQPPQDALIVVVKGTFELAPEGPATAAEESDFVVGELSYQDDPEGSAIYPSDIAVFKPKADVVLTGHAHAPGGSAPGAEVSFRFGTADHGFERRLLVHGDRPWKRSVAGPVPGEPQPFERVPLVYEHAFGGPDYDANPCGRGHGDSPWLPNLELPGQPVTSPKDKRAPACFAPIAMEWKQRWGRLGTYDRAWFKQRWPYFAADFDWSFFQAAPPDQQLDHLRGDEPFEIAGVHQDHRVLEGSLPAERPVCFAVGRSPEQATLTPIVLRLDTVVFDCDAMKLQLVWRGQLDVTADDAPEVGALFIAREPVGETRLSSEQAAVLLARALAPPEPEAPAAAEPVEEIPAKDDDEDPPDPELEALEAQVAENERQTAEMLAAAGLTAVGSGQPPAEPDPEALAAAMAEAGAAPGEIEEALEALRPPEEPPEPAAPEPLPIREQVVGMLRTGGSFAGFDFAKGDLSELDFEGQCLNGALLAGANFGRCNFSGASLLEAQLGGADLSGARFSNAELTAADLTGATLTEAHFDGAELSHVELLDASAQRTRFDGATGYGTMLNESDLSGATFANAKLAHADFTRCRLDGVSFAGAQLPDVTLRAATGADAVFDGASLPGARGDDAQLPRCSLRNVQAPSSVFENALLDEADCSGADLTDSSFLRATCRKANFTQATLVEARLSRAQLGGARFVRANLMFANLEAADLTIADLSGANLHAAGFWKAKLQDAELGGAITTQSSLVMKPPE